MGRPRGLPYSVGVMRSPVPRVRTALISLGVVLAAWALGQLMSTLVRGAVNEPAGAAPGHALDHVVAARSHARGRSAAEQSSDDAARASAGEVTPPTTIPGLLFGPRQHAERYRRELAAAWDAYQRSDLGRAEKAFRHVAAATDAPEPDLVQALYGAGLCREFHRPQADPPGALACFNRIVNEHATSPVAPWALMEIGNLQNDKSQPKQEAAQASYRAVLQRYPESPAADEAALRLADSLFFDLKAPQIKEAAEILKHQLKARPANPLATIMHYRLDYLYGDIAEDYAAALPHAVKVANDKLNDPFRWSRQYWHVAEILRLRLGRTDESVPWYRKIVDECPDSEQSLAAQQMLARIEGREQAAR